tara:strand:+ start:97 stop:642 length:546 start_codon:yes stop_codon:yes gene_type:complete
MSIANKLKTGNLCGASTLQNDILGNFDSLKSGLANQVQGTIASASDIASGIEGNLTSLKNSITSMLPELPDTPNINFQSELKALQNLQVGSAAYLSKFASLKSQFGNLIDLDALGDLSKVDACSLDNLSLPSGTITPIKQSADVILASAQEIVTTKPSIGRFEMGTVDAVVDKVKNYTDVV